MPSPGVQLDATLCTSLSGCRENLSWLVHYPSFADQHLSSFIFHPGVPSHAGSAPPLTRENWCLATPQETLPKEKQTANQSPAQF